jgi:UDP-N-acetylglucosamine/UDP-N-acetylgalactosamine diphosphorylase
MVVIEKPPSSSSDLPDVVARKTNESGKLLHWAGNTAIHIFSREFLERIVRNGGGLPFHAARKKVSYIDDRGQLVVPDEPNAIKFERFIFDVLPLAERALVVEADRAREFNPVKNETGADSPETARQALIAIHRAWLRQAGAQVETDAQVEISPLFALDADDLRTHVAPGTEYRDAVYLR